MFRKTFRKKVGETSTTYDLRELAREIRDDGNRGTNEKLIVERIFELDLARSINAVLGLAGGFRFSSGRNLIVRSYTEKVGIRTLEDFYTLLGLVRDEEEGDGAEETKAEVIKSAESGVVIEKDVTLADLCEMASQVEDPDDDEAAIGGIENTIIKAAIPLIATPEDAKTFIEAFPTKTGRHRTIKAYIESKAAPGSEEARESLDLDALVVLRNMVKSSNFGGTEAISLIFKSAEPLILKADKDTSIEMLRDMALLIRANPENDTDAIPTENVITDALFAQSVDVDSFVDFVGAYGNKASHHRALIAFAGAIGVKSQEEAEKLAGTVRCMEFHGGEALQAIIDAARKAGFEGLDVGTIMAAAQERKRGGMTIAIGIGPSLPGLLGAGLDLDLGLMLALVGDGIDLPALLEAGDHDCENCEEEKRALCETLRKKIAGGGRDVRGLFRRP